MKLTKTKILILIVDIVMIKKFKFGKMGLCKEIILTVNPTTNPTSPE